MPVVEQLSIATKPTRAGAVSARPARVPSALRLPRIIPSLDRMPWLVAFVQTTVGRLALVAAFTLLLGAMKTAGWWQAGVVLAACSLLPAHRKTILAIGAACWIFVHTPVDLAVMQALAQAHGAGGYVKAWPAVVVAVWLLGAGLGWVMGRYASSIGRRPVVVLLAIMLALLLAAQLPLRGAWWFAVAASATVFARYLWFFAYWLVDRKTRAASGLPADGGYWRPFWGFTTVPFGKGPAYLDRVAAKTDADLARVQLKGMKLLLWAAVLTGLKLVVNRIVGESNGPSLDRCMAWIPAGVVPTYKVALEHLIDGRPDPLAIRWLALIVEFIAYLLWLSVMGHKIVATCRMAGFDVFRNTYRPLTSPTIAEFYNRVYYYFKELLVTFFFYPTYLRYFKRHPRLRLFTATLAAAGVGNFLFHFLRDDGNILRYGLWGALKIYHTYAVYALILGVAIALSQMRMLSRDRRPPAGLRKALAIAGVLLFYCLMTAFAEPSPSRSIVHYGSYILSLFWPWRAGGMA